MSPQAARRYGWREQALVWLGESRKLLARQEYLLEVYHGFFLVVCLLITLYILLKWLLAFKLEAGLKKELREVWR